MSSARATVRSTIGLGGLERWLEDAEHRSLRVAEHRDAPDRGVERRDHDRPARCGGLRRSMPSAAAAGISYRH